MRRMILIGDDIIGDEASFAARQIDDHPSLKGESSEPQGGGILIAPTSVGVVVMTLNEGHR